MNAFTKQFIENATGDEIGPSYELTFDEMGESQRSLSKRAGKVGLKVRLTDFFKAAKRRKRAANPIAPNQADIVKWILYDRFQFAAGTTVPNNFKFFTSPIGQGGKTKADTNMEQVQRLADPLWFNTEGVGFYFNPENNITDITNFQASEYMEYWVGQKVYLEGPIQCFPGGSGIAAAISGSAVTSVATNGTPRVDNVYDVRLPHGLQLGTDTNGNPVLSDGLIGITILQGQQFRIEMNAPAGGAALTASPSNGLTVNAYLFGILSRGVQ